MLRLNYYYFIWKKITITLCVGAFGMGTHIAHNIELRVPSRNLVCRKKHFERKHTHCIISLLKKNNLCLFCPFFPSFYIYHFSYFNSQLLQAILQCPIVLLGEWFSNAFGNFRQRLLILIFFLLWNETGIISESFKLIS